MGFPDWREPARLLRENHGLATDEQIAVATRIGLYIDPCEPKAIVAGRIVRHLSGTLLLGPEDPPGSRQLEYLRVLAGSEDLSHLGSLDYAIASRWIQHFLSQRTLTALEQLRLARGDLVTSSWRPPQWDIFLTPKERRTSSPPSGSRGASISSGTAIPE